MSQSAVHHTHDVVVDTERLGQYVRRRRERELGLTREQVSARGGPSIGTQRNIEGNIKPGHRYEQTALVKLARALDWTDDSLDRILRGDEPATRPPEAVSNGSTQAPRHDGWEITVQVRADRQLSDAERAVVEADMLAAARRALLELERRHGA